MVPIVTTIDIVLVGMDLHFSAQNASFAMEVLVTLATSSSGSGCALNVDKHERNDAQPGDVSMSHIAWHCVVQSPVQYGQ